jgi:DNA-directed RNA polymerase, mitochondrial
VNLKTAPSADLVQRQFDLETESVHMGTIRYRSERALPWQDKPGAREEAALQPGKKLLTEAVAPVAAAIEAFLEASETGKAGRKHVALPYLAQIDPEQAAYIAIRTCINHAATRKTLQACAKNIASALQDHLNLVGLAKEHPGLYRKVMEQLSTSTSARHRTGVLRHVQQKYAGTTLSWGERESLLVGSKLVELVAEATGLITEVRMTGASRQTPIQVHFTDEAVAWLDRGHARCELMSPIHLPMVAPPRDWTNPYSGAYYSKAITLRLIKTRSKGYLDELGNIDLSRVYSALNAVQSTPWAINKPVMEVMHRLWEQGGGVAGLPRRMDEHLPPRPEGIARETPVAELTVDQLEVLKLWKARAAEVHTSNAAAKGDRVVVNQKLWIAERFAEEAAIYFPHTLDFRGRVYPVASYVTPQADDTGKALLRFAEGKPLGEDGAFWLAVHIANLFGVDKVSFEDRVAWTMENEEALLESAMSPDDNVDFWGNADSPFCALAACFEWLGYKVAGDEFVSHLPIAMDGSCSGLQHFSAILRDSVGGAAVNLVPAEKPADIYTAVANRAQAVSDASASENELAAAWVGKVGRKIAKQPTMTMCYSATKFGMQGQIRNALKDADKAGKYLPEGTENHPAAVYMAGVVWDAIGEVVIAARTAMDWLQQVSALTAQVGLPLRWTAPNGLPILQEYREFKGKRIDVHFGGRRMELMLQIDTDKISAVRQKSGVAPNFVHALDSAHLMGTANLAVANGMEHFAMIHDSFGVHACDTTRFNRVIRAAFVEQYTPDVLAQFRDEIVAQLQVSAPELVEQMPPLPPKGDLDLDAVLASDFFFA